MSWRRVFNVFNVAVVLWIEMLLVTIADAQWMRRQRETLRLLGDCAERMCGPTPPIEGSGDTLQVDRRRFRVSDMAEAVRFSNTAESGRLKLGGRTEYHVKPLEKHAPQNFRQSDRR